MSRNYGLVDKLVGLLDTLSERGEDMFRGNIAATDKKYLMDAIEVLRSIIEFTE